MSRLLCTCFLLIAATTVWSQVEPSATGGPVSLDDTRMMTPPPVSGDAYPVIVGLEEARSNYLSGGMVFTAAYIDNLMAGGSNGAAADETYSFLPTISLDRTTTRQGESLNYSSGFTLYQNTSQLNGVSQNAAGAYRYSFSPYLAIVVRDSYQQNYNLYNQGNPFVVGGVSGTPGPSNTVLIAPLANQLGNTTSAGVQYQYARNAMIGGDASYSILRYSSPSDVPGLDDANTTGSSGFFSRRLTRSQYAGAVYQFAKIVTHPTDTYTVTNTIFGFYTIYLTKNFSFSVLGGPEHYTSWASTFSRQGSWVPAVEGSFGWRTIRSNVSAAYSHVVSGAGGVIGTYHANISSLDAGVALSRRWSVGASADYALLGNVNAASIAFAYGGGHTIAGTAYLQRKVTEKLDVKAGYSHFHQSYANIPIAASFPDSNRGYVSISYQFNRPLGR